MDRLRSAGRRTLPRDLGDPEFEVGAPLVPRLDTRWLQPAPSSWLGEDRTADAVLRRSDIRLAVTALLQVLPARQRAVFVLREVLGYSSSEAAAVLGTSVPAINSAFQRARAALAGASADPPIARRADEAGRVEQYARALEAGDAPALAQLVTEDVVLEMPPLPHWLRGRALYRTFMADLFRRRGDRWQTRRISANHQPGLLLYRVTDGGVQPHTLHVVTGGADGLLSHLLVYQDPDLFALFERTR
ncbi:sigma factor-like helix-turn-helix DNA-binding protein [Nocardia sp. N2S4-5]|uniref:sigma factor-like helix-turn-helix DNA-binding protein n=1 Tax=Nocardia sp. N2S4-5 TaxID=3351565 RepID=UPI0037D60831